MLVSLSSNHAGMKWRIIIPRVLPVLGSSVRPGRQLAFLGSRCINTANLSAITDSFLWWPRQAQTHVLASSSPCQPATISLSLSLHPQLDANLGVSTDNQTTPPLPPYLPPLLFFLPWVLRAFTLPAKYLPGRMVALQLLCEMNIRHVRSPLPPQQLAIFYLLLQRSLKPSSVSHRDSSQNVQNSTFIV